MIENLMDRSLYFKGLLLLSKIDKDVSFEEKEILKVVGESLGFNKEFCENTIKEVIENKHLQNEPLKISSQQMANMFLRDAIKLAYSDSNLDDDEYKWLLECANINEIPESRVNEQIAKVLNSAKDSSNKQLDVINYDWQSFFLPQVNVKPNENAIS
jgi:tellurite resistance protein